MYNKLIEKINTLIVDSYFNKLRLSRLDFVRQENLTEAREHANELELQEFEIIEQTYVEV